MRIYFNWSAVTGLVDWFIEPEVLPEGKITTITHSKVIKKKYKFSRAIQRVVPRNKERNGRVAAIRLQKSMDASKRKNR